MCVSQQSQGGSMRDAGRMLKAARRSTKVRLGKKQRDMGDSFRKQHTRKMRAGPMNLGVEIEGGR